MKTISKTYLLLHGACYTPPPPHRPPRLQSLMQYCSTRGGVHGLDFCDVLFSGFAADGGMLMPESLPTLSPDTLRSWSRLRFPQLVVEVVSLFIPTHLMPRDHLQGDTWSGVTLVAWNL